MRIADLAQTKNTARGGPVYPADPQAAKKLLSEACVAREIDAMSFKVEGVQITVDVQRILLTC